MLVTTLTASAQFEKGMRYLNAHVSDLDIHFNGANEISFSVQAKGGYFLTDHWLASGLVGLNKLGKGIDTNFDLGAGLRYYIAENSLFLGINATCRIDPDHIDLLPGMEIGYAYMLTDNVSIEPALFYDHSLKNHSDYSTFGVKVGVCVVL